MHTYMRVYIVVNHLQKITITIKWHKGDMMDSSKSLTKSCMSGLSGFTRVVDMDSSNSYTRDYSSN